MKVAISFAKSWMVLATTLFHSTLLAQDDARLPQNGQELQAYCASRDCAMSCPGGAEDCGFLCIPIIECGDGDIGATASTSMSPVSIVDLPPFAADSAGALMVSQLLVDAKQAAFSSDDDEMLQGGEDGEDGPSQDNQPVTRVSSAAPNVLAICDDFGTCVQIRQSESDWTQSGWHSRARHFYNNKEDRVACLYSEPHFAGTLLYTIAPDSDRARLGPAVKSCRWKDEGEACPPAN